MSTLLLTAALLAANLPTGDALAALCLPAAAADSAARDGSKTPDWGGAGQIQIQIARGFSTQRDEQLTRASGIFARLNRVLDDVSQAPEGEGRQRVRDEVTAAGGQPLDEAQDALLQAVELERKRLQLVDKAVRKAAQHKAEVPGADAATVQALLLELESGAVHERVRQRIGGYRYLLRGLAAFLDNDLVAAMRHMELATRTVPDVAIAHQYLGSFYFLARNPRKAVGEWEAALKLDPSNKELERAIQDTKNTLHD